MKPSRLALDMLYPQRVKRRIFWEAIRGAVAVFLIFVLYIVSGRYERDEWEQTRARFLADMSGERFARDLPEHIWIISGKTPYEVKEKLRHLENASFEARTTTWEPVEQKK